MSTYLLLRNNKESGPFTFQQIQEINLKPYDLIWVDGKSAAWRYASEINELKDFAPQIEEQPYDRFYKKVPENKEKHFFEEVEEKTMKAEKLFINENTKRPVMPSSKVYVSLPLSAVKSKPAPPDFMKSEINNEVQQEIAEIVPQKTLLTEKYSQPLEEIKKQYVEKYLQRKNKNKSIVNIKKILPAILIMFFVILLGTLIYFSFRPEEKISSLTYISPMPVNKGINRPLVRNQVTISTHENSKQESQKNKLPEQELNQLPVIETKTHPVEKENKIVSKNDKMIKPAQEEIVINNTPVTNTDENERNKKSGAAQEVIVEKTVDISTQITVKANEYKRRPFGGIFNLQLTINNNSKFMLDKVVVELQYLKPSELPLLIQKINFISIAPNGTQTLKIPDYLRGIKVAYKIVGVESSQYDKYIAGL